MAGGRKGDILVLDVLAVLEVMRACVGDLFLDGLAHGGGRGMAWRRRACVGSRGNKPWAGGAYLWQLHMPGGIVSQAHRAPRSLAHPALGARIGLPPIGPDPRLGLRIVRPSRQALSNSRSRFAQFIFSIDGRHTTSAFSSNNLRICTQR